jgi:hypothetical protein
MLEQVQECADDDLAAFEGCYYLSDALCKRGRFAPPPATCTTTLASGTSFVDKPGTWVRKGDAVGSWSIYEPIKVLKNSAQACSKANLNAAGAPAVFCEPGRNWFCGANVYGQGQTLLLVGERLWPAVEQLPGPYLPCSDSAPACQYRFAPQKDGTGSGSQVERGSLLYGFGSYRAIMRTNGNPGFVYAFYTQGNEPCADGVPNPDCNDSEIDVELQGEADGGQLLVFSNWQSAIQGIGCLGPADPQGFDRHAASIFRFVDKTAVLSHRTYGFDWESQQVTFFVDSTPGLSEPTEVAVCRHKRYVPQRPAPLHLQTWNATFAGTPRPDTRGELTVLKVWHTRKPLPPTSTLGRCRKRIMGRELCPQITYFGTKGCQKLEPDDKCQRSGECNDLARCLDNKCRPRFIFQKPNRPCFTSDACDQGHGFTCGGGASCAKRVVDSCEGDGECGGLACIHTACVKRPGQTCEKDADCFPARDMVSDRCIFGTCGRMPAMGGACSSDLQCRLAGGTCVGNLCVPRPKLGEACDSNDDCPGTCVDSICTRRPGLGQDCDDDWDCDRNSLNRRCFQGKCLGGLAKDGDTCDSDLDCVMGYYCDCANCADGSDSYERGRSR